MKRRHATWILVAALLVGTFLRSTDLLEPRYENGHRGACAAFFSLMAKNHLRYGLGTTFGVSVLNPVKTNLRHLNYYLHHPPGAVLLATVGAHLGGTNPAGLRLIFLPFSVGIVLLVYRLARRRGRATAAAAGVLAALAPLGVWYGAFVNFEIPTIFFLLLTLYFVARHERSGRPRDRNRAWLAQAAAVGCDWIALGVPICLLALAPFARRRRDEPTRARRSAPMIGGLAVAGLLTLGLVMLQGAVQLSRFGLSADPEGRGAEYYRQVTPLADDFTWARWQEQVGGYALELLGPWLLGLAALGLLLELDRLRRRRVDAFGRAALVTTVVGLTNVLLLGNHARGHDYYLLYLLPAVALLGASTLGAIAGVGRRPTQPGLRLAAAAVLLVAVAVQLTLASQRVIDRRTTYELARVGENVRQAVPDEQAVVLLPYGMTAQVTATADRLVLPARNLQQLGLARQQALRLGMAGQSMLLLVPAREATDPLDPSFREQLEAHRVPEARGPFLVYDLGVLKPR